MQLQVKKPQKSRLRYLERNKQQTRRHLRYLEISKLGKRCPWFFQKQRTKPKVNKTFSAVKKKIIRCGWCIYRVNCNRIGAANAITSQNATKQQKQHIQNEINK